MLPFTYHADESNDEKREPSDPPPTPIHTLRGLLLFTFFSVAGVSTRLLLSVLAPTHNTNWWSVNPTIVANIVGSAMAGLLKGRLAGKMMMDDSATGERK